MDCSVGYSNVQMRDRLRTKPIEDVKLWDIVQIALGNDF